MEDTLDADARLSDGGYLFPKSPATVNLSPLLTAENPASVNAQSVMTAR